MLKSKLFLLLLLISMAGVSTGAEICLKKVFNEYCLGDTLEQQLKRTPVNMQPRSNGDRAGVIYEKDNEKIYVMAYKGVIYKVLHTYEPQTQATMKDLRRRLQRIYGNYQDLSEYPDNTKNKSRQISTIRRGDGELRNVWQLPGQPWRVELGWTRKLGVSIAFFINELDEMQKEAARQGL